MKQYTLNDSRKINVHTLSRVLSLVMVLSLCVFSIPATFCTDASTTNASTVSNLIMQMITDMSSQLYITMRGVVIPLVIVALGIAGICFLVGGSKGAQTAFTIVKYSFAAVCFVAFAPLIGQQFGMWVQNSGTGDLGQYNPLNG